MQYTISQIAAIVQTQNVVVNEHTIRHVIIDSRKIVFPNSSIFFAIRTNTNNGHNYIKDLYNRGVQFFVIDETINEAAFTNAIFLRVNNSLQALQLLATYHRKQFNIPVIAITGSNGKTIVKEWLYQLLQQEYNIIRSPRSYNSQIGVPLSVLEMQAEHTLAIFEAGISTVSEMGKLANIIQPTITVITNLGDAHNEGFTSAFEKLQEKLLLTHHTQISIYNTDTEGIANINFNTQLHFTWSKKQNALVKITNIATNLNTTIIEFTYQQIQHQITIPFTDKASIENTINCLCCMLALNYNINTIASRMLKLQSVDMRMQLKKGINGCYIVNDSYSNDYLSLQIALQYIKQQAGNNAVTVILSDFLQQNNYTNIHFYKDVIELLIANNVTKFIAIGVQLNAHKELFKQYLPNSFFYVSTQQFLKEHAVAFKHEFILLKGARVFEFELIDKQLQQQVHNTVLEVNLTAIVHNLKAYQKHLQPGVMIMAMVKAFSYGSGTVEIARALAFHKTNYLAVAYTDEGVELRKAGIELPIMVMNADESGFDLLLNYNLEPEIYSFNILHQFIKFLKHQAINHYPVHIKLNTGMNRLGFDVNEVEELSNIITESKCIYVKSVFSHLTSSENHLHDNLTTEQANSFIKACNTLQQKIGYQFIQHIANSAAIIRHPQFQFNMVRLGIGLYGVDDANNHLLHLQTVATLKTTIAQLRKLKKGDTVGYNRVGVVNKDSLIATIRIGYADGFSRRLSNGIGKVFINGYLAPTIGNVCMDMTMIDVTHIPNVKEGDIVEIFGSNLPVQQVAKWCNTISYEILTSVSQRVKRIYIEE